MFDFVQLILPFAFSVLFPSTSLRVNSDGSRCDVDGLRISRLNFNLSMLRNFAILRTVFFKNEFIFRVLGIFFSRVVAGFADRTFKLDQYSFCFCHLDSLPNLL